MNAVENVAIVRDADGLVLTILRGDASPVVPLGFHAVPESELSAGWSRIVEAEDTPEIVTRWRLRKALLLRFFITSADVESFIVARTSPGIDRELALVDWKDSPEVRRDHPLIEPFVWYLSQVRGETIDADEFFRFAQSLDR